MYIYICDYNEDIYIYICAHTRVSVRRPPVAASDAPAAIHARAGEGQGFESGSSCSRGGGRVQGLDPKHA